MHRQIEIPPLRVAIIGLGHRGLKRGLGEFQKAPNYDVIALCDPDKAAMDKASSSCPGAATFHSVGKLLEAHRHPETPLRLDCAYLAVPHICYGDIVPALVSHRIHLLKEKPAGMTAEDVERFQELAREHKVCLLTASQKRFGEQCKLINQWLPLIGEVQFIEGTRKINVANLAEGWRAQSASAGGGVVRDLGWHLIDLVLSLTGRNYLPRVRHASMIKTRKAEDYDCEDSAHLAVDLVPQCTSSDASQVVPCSLRISRIGHEEVDELLITGDAGLIAVRGGTIVLSAHSTLSDQAQHVSSSASLDFRRMLDYFASQIRQGRDSDKHHYWASQDAIISKLIDEIYSCDDGTVSDSETHVADIRSARSVVRNREPMSWPKMTEDVLHSIQSQALDSISIYGNEGVFSRFESEFAAAMGQSDAYALLHNSGTNAMQALYYAIGLQPQDEVIFPVYTFHATCSPAMAFGIAPIFCDVDMNGNLDPEALGRLVTDQTRAVVVTHMWGIPCQMRRILDVLHRHPGVLLFEDCSHAHGATLDGQAVGTFGDGAVWSLQGQKIISGGEGGISVTRHRELHIKQLIWGHYNKRCKLEIPVDHELRPYLLTGAGMKNRAHPLAVAVALNQLQKLAGFLKTKRKFALAIASSLENIKFLQGPDTRGMEKNRIEPAWYAFPFYFDELNAPPGLSRAKFVEELLAEGLPEMDIPSSTRPLHREALFVSPEAVLPHVYSSTYTDHNAGREFPNAARVHGSIIKMPVWAFEDDDSIIEHYISRIAAVARRWSLPRSKL